jgi:hypothetical protein
MFIDPFVPSLVDELIKIGSVRGPVKQYRQSLQLLSGGQTAFHGVNRAAERLPGILQTGGLKPSLGAHNSGVYMWNQKGPALTYLHTPESTGFAFPHPKPGTFRQPSDLRPEGGMRPRMTIWNHLDDQKGNPTTPFKLPPKSSLIAPPGQIQAARQLQTNPSQNLPGGALQHRRLKPIDSATFNRAEADLKANRIKSTDGYGEYATRPSKKELIDLNKRKTAPPKIRKLRADSEKDIIDFADSYPNLVSRKT